MFKVLRKSAVDRGLLTVSVKQLFFPEDVKQVQTFLRVLHH